MVLFKSNCRLSLATCCMERRSDWACLLSAKCYLFFTLLYSLCEICVSIRVKFQNLLFRVCGGDGEVWNELLALVISSAILFMYYYIGSRFIFSEERRKSLFYFSGSWKWFKCIWFWTWSWKWHSWLFCNSSEGTEGSKKVIVRVVQVTQNIQKEQMT